MWLVSLPFCWSGWALSALKMPLCVPLLRTAWRLSGNSEAECKAIQIIQLTAGPEPALAEAVWAMDVRPSSPIAAIAGLLAHGTGDSELAGEMLARGRNRGSDSMGMMEVLEYVVKWPDRDEFNKYIDSLARRRDLNPYLTKMVTLCLAWREIAGKQLADARRRANRVLEIEEDPQARMILWAIELQVGSAEAAAQHLTKADKMAQELRTFYEIQGHTYAGNLDQARLLLAELGPSNADLAQRAELYLRHAEEALA